MAKFCASNWLLYIESAIPGTFLAIAGTQELSLSINSGTVDTTEKSGSNHWTELLANCGLKNISISASGFVTDSIAFGLAQTAAMTGGLKLYRVVSGNGDTFNGTFATTAVERSGASEDAEAMSISIESAGIVTLTPGVKV